jgi:hypothetical protein
LELAGFERIDVDERSLDRHILATATRPGTAALRYESGGAPLCRIRGEQESRLISFALHAGHVLRPGLARHMGIGPGVRRREEDPLTALMAPPHGRTIEVLRSRFEIDLNRPIERAVYGGPEDAWGLNVWRDGVLVQDEAVASRLVYEEFYRIARDEVAAVISADTPCILLDLHSYNHRRGGSEAPAADPVSNPEINIGTRSIDRERWAPVIDAFIKELRSAGLDVGENVKFGGGHLCRWVAADFSEVVCPLAIEFKKTFVDEWSGVPDRKRIDSLRTAVAVASKAAVQASSQMR